MNFLQQEVWAYFTNSLSDPVAFVNKNEGKSVSSFSRVVVFTILGVGHFDRNPVMFAVQVSRNHSFSSIILLVICFPSATTANHST